MKNNDLIDSYFENSLSPKEQKIFNDLLQNNIDFKNEFQFQKDLKKVIASKQREELKSVLTEIEERAQRKSTILSIPKKWMVAASLLIIVGIGTWGVKSTYYPSNESIYSDYFEPSRNTVQPVVRGENINTIEYRAFVAYESENYHKAINLFNSVKNPDEAYVDFYKGLCLMATDKTHEAIEILEPISKMTQLEGKNKDFSEKARWYLALNYVKLNDDTKAKNTLLAIINDNDSNYKKEEATEILNFLD
ncbi:tetratricopeptide repeat protein [Lutimonas sp.]|uniref:tetratricopeptide repeat protein n=1 Tax=Lutimonas sp. TaxID=1872403 RepID=UPI003D9BB6CD